MRAYLNGIGWVTGDGPGWGSRGGECRLSSDPIAPLARKDVFPAPNQRFGRMSEYAKLGVAALAFALRDAGLEAWDAKRPMGVVAATRLGCLATDLDYQRTVLLEGGGLASPNLFAYTLANCFLGDAAILFGMTGSLLALNEAGDGIAALGMALDELLIGDAEAMLAGFCDLAPPEMPAAGNPQGALFLVLSRTPSSSGNGYGEIRLAADGGILYGGAGVDSLSGLVKAALAGRPGARADQGETT